MNDKTVIGVFNHGWWGQACKAASIDMVEFPVAHGANGNTHAANLEDRLRNGAALLRTEASNPTRFWLDNGGTGLNFVGRADDAQSGEHPNHTEGMGDIHLAHEFAGRLLVSHFIDPITTTFQGLPWDMTWQALQSQTWIKAVWDKAQASELTSFGVPGVVHLPMAAPNRRYATDALDPNDYDQLVSFVGGQNTSLFSADNVVKTEVLLPGALAHAVRADMPEITFYDVYHDLYALGAPVTQSDDIKVREQKAINYFNAKLYYNAGLCLAQRDRYVIYLKRKMGSEFQLIGDRWDVAYGLDNMPPIPSNDGYFDHFRRTAINLNFVNGNAESGLNMRHFEVTAAGGFLLCEDHPELSENFEIGKECDVFRNETELIEKIQEYQTDGDRRCKIALAGQRRTLTEHLYSHRVRSLSDTMSDHLNMNSTSSPVTMGINDAKGTDSFSVFERQIILDAPKRNKDHTAGNAKPM